MNQALKRLLRVGLTAWPVSRVWAPFKRGRGTIFMFHRFADGDLGTTGHDPKLLRSALAYLRRERYQLVSLTELFGRLRDGARTLDRSVAFTMDDGYLDQGTVGGEIFAAFDCPVTTFVTTGFVDGALWMWWDRIEYVFQATQRPALELELDSTPLRYARDPIAGYRHARDDFTERCKAVAESHKLAGIERLAAAAEVTLPERPPLRYAPMSWEQVRALEQRGMTVGPHTVTHPVLAHTTMEHSHREIEDSWRRLQTQAAHPTAIFCYPNGQLSDFGDREVATLRALNFTGAVVGTTGYAQAQAFAAEPDARFRVRRFSYPDDMLELTQCASGLEWVNQMLRGVS